MTELAVSLSHRLPHAPISMARMGEDSAVVADAGNEIWLLNGGDRLGHVLFGDPTEDRLRSVATHRSNKMLVACSGSRVRALLPDHEDWTWTVQREPGTGLALESGSADIDDAGRIVACFDDGTFGLWSRGGISLITGYSDVPYRQAAFVDAGLRVALCTGFALDIWNIRTGVVNRIRTWNRRALHMTASRERGWVAVRTPDRVSVLAASGDSVFETTAKCSGAAPCFLSQGTFLAISEGRVLKVMSTERREVVAQRAFPESILCLVERDEGLMVGIADGSLLSVALRHR